MPLPTRIPGPFRQKRLLLLGVGWQRIKAGLDISGLQLCLNHRAQRSRPNIFEEKSPNPPQRWSINHCALQKGSKIFRGWDQTLKILLVLKSTRLLQKSIKEEGAKTSNKASILFWVEPLLSWRESQWENTKDVIKKVSASGIRNSKAVKIMQTGLLIDWITGSQRKNLRSWFLLSGKTELNRIRQCFNIDYFWNEMMQIYQK